MACHCRVSPSSTDVKLGGSNIANKMPRILTKKISSSCYISGRKLLRELMAIVYTFSGAFKLKHRYVIGSSFK